MPAIPRVFRAYFHPQARRSGNSLRTIPVRQPITPVQIERYSGKVQGVPLTGGQALGTVADETCTLQVGPQGLGTVWYPAQVTISTTTGALDTSTALIYAGPLQVASNLVGTIYTGNGTAALAIPPMTPGQTVIVAWSGAHNGDTCSMNITGTMDALTVPRSNNG